MPQGTRTPSRQNFPAEPARKQVQQPVRAPAEPTEGRPRSGGPALNKVMLIGTLTRDPEMKTTAKGTSVAELGLALNRTYTTDQGERREETSFVDVELWGRQAEIAGEYLRKGRPVFVEGRLKLDSWEDKETGQRRSKLRVVGEIMQLLGGRDGNAENGPARPLPPPQRSASRTGRGGYEEESPM